jgi:hypothetical protein
MTKQSFTNYYTKMPWLAMLFDEKQKKNNLMTMFKVQVSVFLFLFSNDDCAEEE